MRISIALRSPSGTIHPRVGNIISSDNICWYTFRTPTEIILGKKLYRAIKHVFVKNRKHRGTHFPMIYMAAILRRTRQRNTYIIITCARETGEEEIERDEANGAQY